MVGRPKKPITKIFRDLSVESEDGQAFKIKEVLIRCPNCKSHHIGENGTQARGSTRIQGYICKNSHCSFLKKSKGGKQFTLFSSMLLMLILEDFLEKIMKKLFQSRGKLINIAKDYGFSPSLMSYLYKKLQNAMDRYQGLQHLVNQKQEDLAISVDETFLKINGKAFYIIMATGYSSHKVLGIKVSKTRKMTDLKDVFEEAEGNTINRIQMITADAWNATQALAYYLDRPITIIIHKHKKPYVKVVIKKYEYTRNERIITIIGLKSDFCKKRGVKEYFHMQKHEPRYPPPKKKQGRPKGVQNSRRKKKQKPRKKKKRGRKGLFTVFNQGKRGYAKVDPYRKTIRVGRDISNAVAAALGDVVKLYARQYIQNNLAEHKNSVISNNLVLSGPKTAKSIERRLRTFIICQNNPTLLENLYLEHKFQRKFLMTQFQQSPLLKLWIGEN
jgi:hypothetical protein